MEVTPHIHFVMRSPLTTAPEQRDHKKKLLYDELYGGYFWEIGERKKPDEDGVLRSIVVQRGYFAPDNERDPDDDEQPPEDWEAYINPRAVTDIGTPNLSNLPQPVAARVAPSLVVRSAPALSLATRSAASSSTSRPFAVPAVAPPRVRGIQPQRVAHPHADPSAEAPILAPASVSRPSATRAVVPPPVGNTLGAGLVGHRNHRTIHGVIDISSDEEDVKPSLAELNRENSPMTFGSRRVEVKREDQAPARNEARTQEDRFQPNPFLSNNLVEPAYEPAHNRNRSMQESANRQVAEARPRMLEQPAQLQPAQLQPPQVQLPQLPSENIWAYMTLFARTPTPFPDDVVIRELLKMPRRRELPAQWHDQLRAFNALNLTELTACIWYLGGNQAGWNPCTSFKCSLRAFRTRCHDRNHMEGKCESCRQAFPRCVHLPQGVLSSPAVRKRLGNYICCNHYVRISNAWSSVAAGAEGGQRNYEGSAARYKDDIATIQASERAASMN